MLAGWLAWSTAPRRLLVDGRRGAQLVRGRPLGRLRTSFLSSSLGRALVDAEAAGGAGQTDPVRAAVVVWVVAGDSGSLCWWGCPEAIFLTSLGRAGVVARAAPLALRGRTGRRSGPRVSAVPP